MSGIINKGQLVDERLEYEPIRFCGRGYDSARNPFQRRKEQSTVDKTYLSTLHKKKGLFQTNFNNELSVSSLFSFHVELNY